MATKSTTFSPTANRPSPDERPVAQLVLAVDNTGAAPWRIDDETREIGRQGLAKARAALSAARPFALDAAA